MKYILLGFMIAAISGVIKLGTVGTMGALLIFPVSAVLYGFAIAFADFHKKVNKESAIEL